MTPTSKLRVVVVAFFALAFLQLTLVAQMGASTGLQGVVTDPSGGVIPGASVTIIRVETGEERVVMTNDSGDWEARFFSPGLYRLIFELPAFKKLTRDGVTVTTAEVGTVNVQLEVGEIGQVVEVSAEAAMVSSNSATLVRTLDSRELENLPTSSRNPVVQSL